MISKYLVAMNDVKFNEFDKREIELIINGHEYHSAKESCTDDELDTALSVTGDMLNASTETSQSAKQSETTIVVMEPWWRTGRMSIDA